jgi:hypothetical protein
MINSLNSELNPICHLLALLSHPIFHVSGIRVKENSLCPPVVYMQTFAGDRLLGIQFLPPRLASAVYRYSHGNVLPELLQDVDLQTVILLWFMRDGSQPHILLPI